MALLLANGGGSSVFTSPTVSHNNFLASLLSRRARMKLSMAASNKKASTFKMGNPSGKSNANGQSEMEKSMYGVLGDADFLEDDEANLEIPKLPGLEPDFFEGPQWDGFGFFVQYMWAFGLLFAVVACGIAVATYNGGATDFKDTPAYQESLKMQEQEQQFFEEPDEAMPDVFESNPTEVAPSLE